MNYLILPAILILMSMPSLGLGGSPPEPSKNIALIIDDFEDSNYTKSPEWWVFGGINLTIASSPAKGKASLSAKGAARNWYVGGMGLYLGSAEAEYSKYSHLDIDVFGAGAKSGTLKIELSDDDNGNWQIEKDPSKDYAPIYDDRFSYEVKINWQGWKRVSIPLSEFIDTNPEAGDNIWNPNKAGESGGLLEMQFIALAPSKTGKIDFVLDDIGFNGGIKQ